MQRRALAIGVAVAVAALGAEAQSPGASLDDLLRPYLAAHGLPAIAAAVVRDGRLLGAGAVGTRRAGADIPVTLNDRFHLGSDTKAMTALLAAMMVEEGRLRWDTSVAEAFPMFLDRMVPALRPVTLRQLLSHSSGMPGDNDAFGRLLMESFAQDAMNLDGLRLWLVGEWVKQPLVAAPGAAWAYSNMGYTMAGAMIERAAGMSWEELISRRLFDPLGLATAGLGPQSSLGRVDAPLGHMLLPDGQLKPMLAGPDGDNPAIIGPAGLVHMSILDFATWAGWHAGQGRRGPALVRTDTLRLLHDPVIGVPPGPGLGANPAYGLGWGVLTAGFTTAVGLEHAGSNNLNRAVIFVQPAQDFAMVMTTNVAGARAEAALAALSDALYARFGPAPRG
ncbi:serine hydrolase domain-containing protein [Humitalea sp. 24SJ18S-53]|uniref:serine hydrolase domain-containing protein n=1 Tax=Humitalea sp. 24SJ18S-53 TaxID=3422307 RepID=UPI003D67B08B